MKLLEWQRECESVIAYYRTWRDAEVEFTQAFIDEANRELQALAEVELDWQTIQKDLTKAVNLEETDFAPVLALAEPLLTEARRLAERAREGQLDGVADDMLLRIGERWLALDSALGVQVMAPAAN